VSERPLWIEEDQVKGLLSMAAAIDVLDSTYRLQRQGLAGNMSRAHLRENGSILHAVGGVIAGEGVAGTKTWIHTAGGAAPVLVLFDLEDGGVRAVIEAFAMGQIRTAATSGLGTRYLARQESSTLAVLGTGKQSFTQAEAVICERPIRAIRLFGRDPERRAATATRMRESFGVEVGEHGDVAETVRGADVITVITRAEKPILFGEMLEPGQHVNAVGSIVPTKLEVSADLVGRCDLVAVDSIPQAEDDAAELRAAVEEGLLQWDAVRSLASLTAPSTSGSRNTDDITLFKALGIGVSDVALGVELLRQVERSDDDDAVAAPATPRTKS